MDLKQKAMEDPLVHPVPTSIKLLNYPLPPGDHLRNLYHKIWRAISPRHPQALRQIAALMPRGHGKSEAATIVTPTWAILRWPEIKIAVISKTKGSASEKVQKVGEVLDRHADRFGIQIEEKRKGAVKTRANKESLNKEPTISAHGINSQITGGHYDIIIFDDIVDYENQRLESRRQKIRNTFRDYKDNLEEKQSDSPIGGCVKIVIGTRKHPNDLYATEILENKSWEVFVEQALSDWSIVEDGAYEILCDDGETYEEPQDIPDNVKPIQNGVRPLRQCDVLWPSHKPLDSLLFDVVFGDDANAVWQRENQNDPQALSGTVFSADMLGFVAELPKDEDDYQWCAGVDQAHIDDMQAAAEGDTDYWAVAVVARDKESDNLYLTDLARQRGIIGDDAREFIENTLSESPAERVYMEENFAQSNMIRNMKDESSLKVTGVSTGADKMTRYQDNLVPEFQRGRLKIVDRPLEGAIQHPQRAIWQQWLQNEWLQLPDAKHDDMTDAIEFAVRKADTTNEWMDPDDLENITWD